MKIFFKLLIATAFVLVQTILSIQTVFADTPYLVSSNSQGQPGYVSGNALSYPDISADGHYVIFTSSDNTLVSNDTSYQDVFRKDTLTGQIVKVNLDTNGNNPSTSGPQSATAIQISADGKKVLFSEFAALTPDDTNSTSDLYLKNFTDNSITRVGVGDQSQQLTGGIFWSRMSSDSSQVFFDTDQNVVTGMPAGTKRIYVRNISAGTTEIVPVSSQKGSQGAISLNDVSADGRYVLYTDFYDITDPVSGSTFRYEDVIVYDTLTGVSTFANVSSSGEKSNHPVNEAASISPNGRYVTFYSSASNLAPNTSGQHLETFMHDLTTGATTLVSTGLDGSEANGQSYTISQSNLSNDGRYVLFDSIATNLVSNTQSTGNDRIYIKDTVTNETRFVIPDTFNAQASEDYAISANGQYVTYRQGSALFKRSVFAIFSNDRTPPIVTGNPDRLANTNGWYNSPVTITWSVSDPSPSSGTPTTPSPAIAVANLEGTNIYTSTQSCDPAGNCATGSLNVSIDTLLPAGTFTGSTNVIRPLLNQHITGTAADITSGVDRVEIISGATTLNSSMGSITLSCNAASTSCTWDANTASLTTGSQTLTLKITDKAGNIFTTTKSYTII